MAESRGESRFETEYLGGYGVGPGIFEALSRFRWLVVLTSIAAALVALALSYLQATTYEAEASMPIIDPRTSGIFDDSSWGIADLSRYVRNQAMFTESSVIAARTVELLADTDHDPGGLAVRVGDAVPGSRPCDDPSKSFHSGGNC